MVVFEVSLIKKKFGGCHADVESKRRLGKIIVIVKNGQAHSKFNLGQSNQFIALLAR